MRQALLNYNPPQAQRHQINGESSSIITPSVSITPPIKEAYQDIKQFYDRLAGISFYGSYGEEFYNLITHLISTDKNLPKRTTQIPLEYRLEEEPSLLGECVFDKGENMWVPARDVTQPYQIFLGINTDFYKNNY